MQHISTIGKKLLHHILGLHCISCPDEVTQNQTMCHNCWNDLIFIGKDKCSFCSYPLQREEEDSNICLNCLQEKPHFETVFCNLIYNDKIASIIISFKYADQTYLAKYLAHLITNGLDKKICFQIVCCVPMSSDDVVKRRYNQAALLAQIIYKNIKTETMQFLPDLLLKTRRTKKQNQLTQEQRKTNVKRAFMLNPKYTELSMGPINILLIDDVMTTGSTVNECSWAIKKKWPKANVYIGCCARVLK